MSEGYTIATRIFSILIIGFGMAMVIVTIANGGSAGALGIVFGLLFTAVGVGRLYLSFRS